MKPARLLHKFFRLIRGFFLLTASLALGLYFRIATFTRPIGDDYCFSAWNSGVGPLISGLYKYTTTSNRFSNQFVVYASDVFGPRGVGILSASVMVLWLFGLTFLLSEIARTLRIRWNLWTGVLLTELILLVSYYSAANLYQSVMWRPGLMTYSLPLALFTFVFAGILRGTCSASGGRASLWTIGSLFFAAFWIGGLSETAGALHISILGLALIATRVWNKSPSRRAALGLISAALAGALLALIGMFLAPANAFRMEPGTTPTLPGLVRMTLLFGLQFLGEAMHLLIQPILFAIGCGTLLGYISAKLGDVDAPASHKLWIGLVILPILAYLLIIASFAPSAYGQSYPAERVRFPAHVLLIILFLLEGGMAGLFAARINLPRWITALALLALVIAALYPLWITRNNLPLLYEHQARAGQWDQRDAQIRERAASGEKNIVVWQLPGIANVKDLDTRERHWINYCAAVYYGVNTISASPEIPIP